MGEEGKKEDKKERRFSQEQYGAVREKSILTSTLSH
jgi:hypothetical protein